jgi:hypothetical protein
MTETELEADDGFTLEDEPSADEAPAEAPEKANDQNAAASKKDPLPEGWETPTAFAHRLSDVLEGYDKTTNPFKPQMVYGYVKNGKDFPQKNHTDGRFIVEIEPALAWIQVRVEKRKEREAAKVAAAAAAEATPAEEAPVEE